MNKVFSIFLILLTFPNSSYASSLFKYHQVLMGTKVEITLVGDREKDAKKGALQAFQEIRKVEYLMSPWIGSSDVTRVNRSAGKEWVRVSPETLTVIKKAQEISKLSEGAFDITIGPLSELWRQARDKEVPPSMEDVKKNLGLVNYRDLLIDSGGSVFLKRKGMAIDLGGIAKGYAVDKAFELLRALGYRNLIVNGGGDLRAGGLKRDRSWNIGIQDPRTPQKVMAKISTSVAAVATSGDYEKFFIYQGKRYHHIFSPKSGFPTEGFQSVTIVCKDLMTADALATAAFVLGPENGPGLLQKLEGVDWFIMDQDGRRALSPGLKKRISFTP